MGDNIFWKWEMGKCPDLRERVSNKKKAEESRFEPTPRWAVLDSNQRRQQKMRPNVMRLKPLGHAD